MNGSLITGGADGWELSIEKSVLQRLLPNLARFHYF